jgi:hypothetical protein
MPGVYRLEDQASTVRGSGSSGSVRADRELHRLYDDGRPSAKRLGRAHGLEARSTVEPSRSVGIGGVCQGPRSQVTKGAPLSPLEHADHAAEHDYDRAARPLGAQLRGAGRRPRRGTEDDEAPAEPRV